MIRARNENSGFMAAQCSLNTVKAIRSEMIHCNGDYEAVACKK